MSRDPRVEIDPAILEIFPHCRVGAFVATGLRSIEPPDLSVEAARAFLEERGLTPDNLTGDPRIREWRKAIGLCGLKPSACKSSPEQLAGRLLRGKGISTPLLWVDAYSAVSAKHLAPLGAYDLDRLPEPTVRLRFARPGADTFHPLGGRAEDMPLKETVAVYASGNEVICWAFNHRDSAVTCLRPETGRALFIGEAVEEEQYEALEAALEELRELLEGRGAEVGGMVYLPSKDGR